MVSNPQVSLVWTVLHDLRDLLTRLLGTQQGDAMPVQTAAEELAAREAAKLTASLLATKPRLPASVQRQARRERLLHWFLSHGYTRKGRSPARIYLEHPAFRTRWELRPTRVQRFLRSPTDLTQRLVAWVKTADLDAAVVEAIWQQGITLPGSAELHPEDLPEVCPKYEVVAGVVMPARKR